MITDRTAADVIEARRIQQEKLVNGITPTMAEQAVLEKGFCTKETVNRILAKQHEVSELLADQGYYGAIDYVQYDSSDNFFYKTDFLRILTNDQNLRQEIVLYPTVPRHPDAVYHYTTFNALELLLVMLEEIAENIDYNYCGEINCGGV